jgi:4-hydroxy-tetrahydrodipicolinate synthase
LPFIALGAAGFVSVIGHVVADRLQAMIEAFEHGDVDTARSLHVGLLPVHRAMQRVGGAAFGKLAVELTWWYEVGPTRLPLPPVTAEQIAAVAADLAEANVPLSRSFFPPQPTRDESPAADASRLSLQPAGR